MGCIASGVIWHHSGLSPLRISKHDPEPQRQYPLSFLAVHSPSAQHFPQDSGSWRPNGPLGCKQHLGLRGRKFGREGKGKIREREAAKRYQASARAVATHSHGHGRRGHGHPPVFAYPPCPSQRRLGSPSLRRVRKRPLPTSMEKECNRSSSKTADWAHASPPKEIRQCKCGGSPHRREERGR